MVARPPREKQPNPPGQAVWEMVMPIYMKYTGIDGDVKDSGYEKFIALNSFQWGIGRGINNDANEADRESTVPSVSEIVVTKDNDCASPNLFRASLGVGDQGSGKDVEIHWVWGDASNQQTFLKLALTNTLVSGWSVSGSSGAPGQSNRPSETVTLNFTKVEYTNTPMDPTGAGGGPDTARYDMTTHSGG